MGYGPGGSALGSGPILRNTDSPLAGAIAARLADSRQHQVQDAAEPGRTALGPDDEGARLGVDYRACRAIQVASFYQYDQLQQHRRRADGFHAPGDLVVRTRSRP